MKNLDLSKPLKRKFSKVYRRCVLFDDVDAWMLGSASRVGKIIGVSSTLVRKARDAGYFQTRLSLAIYDLSGGAVKMRRTDEVAAYLILKNEFKIGVKPDDAIKTFNQVINGKEITTNYEKLD